MRGDLVVYRRGGDLHPAVLCRRAGRPDVCLGPDGGEDRKAVSRVVLELERTAGPGDLEAFWSRVEERTAEVDLEILWEASRAESRERTSDELAALWFGDALDPVDRAAVLARLEADRIWFKQKGEAFVPRPERVVEAARVREERTRQNEEARAELVAILAALHDDEAEDPGPPGDHLGPFLDRLEDFAVRGEDSGASGWARDLLDDADRPAEPGEAAACLVELGVLEPDLDLHLRRHRIPRSFPGPVLEAASRIRPFRGDDGDRLDLRDLWTVTVDDASTTDRDDGLAVEPTARGFRLHVLVADVAHFVAPDGPIDAEALARGSSIYLPDGQVPMIPPEVGVERASLLEGTDRPSVAITFGVDRDGTVESEGIARAVVHVDRNLTYEEVDRVLTGETDGDLPADRLRSLGELARELREARRARGALILERPEVDIEPRAGGPPDVRIVADRSPARHLIAELMIRANGAGARFCREHAVPAIYRTMPAPESPLPDRSEYPHPSVYGSQIGRHLGRTETGAAPGPHHALGLDAYIQWTSPIRRYGDLVLQRQIAGALEGEAPYRQEELVEVASAASSARSRSRRVESARRRFWILRHIRATRDAERTALHLRQIGSRKHLVELQDCLAREAVRTDRHLEPGDTFSVRVVAVDPLRDVLRLEPA